MGIGQFDSRPIGFYELPIDAHHLSLTVTWPQKRFRLSDPDKMTITSLEATVRPIFGPGTLPTFAGLSWDAWLQFQRGTFRPPVWGFRGYVVVGIGQFDSPPTGSNYLATDIQDLLVTIFELFSWLLQKRFRPLVRPRYDDKYRPRSYCFVEQQQCIN